MRRRLSFIWLLLLWHVVPVHALDLNHLPEWVRSALTPLCIDWQQVYRESEAAPLPAPLVTGGLLPVYTPGYGSLQNLPRQSAASTAVAPHPTRTANGFPTAPISGHHPSPGLPKPVSGGSGVLKGIGGAAGSPAAPLATVQPGGASLPKPHLPPQTPASAAISPLTTRTSNTLLPAPISGHGEFPVLPKPGSGGIGVLKGVGGAANTPAPLATVQPGGASLPKPLSAHSAAVRSIGGNSHIAAPLATVRAGGTEALSSAGETGLKATVVAGSSGLPSVGTASGAEGGVSSLTPVSTPGLTKRLHANPAAAQKLMLTMRTLFDIGQLDDTRLPQWLVEQKVDQAALIQALDQMTLAHPMDEMYLPICRALWHKIGPDLAQYLRFPYKARIIMGIYLAVLEREDDAKKLFASVPEEWQKRDPSVPMYHVANEILVYRHKAPRLAIWAWKRGAEMAGPKDVTFVCGHIAFACRRIEDRQQMEDAARDLIAWTEDGMSLSGSECNWHIALPELTWAYGVMNQAQKGEERRQYWVGEAINRGCAPQVVGNEKTRQALALIDQGRFRDAADLLKQAIQLAGDTAEVAQEKLLALSREHPELGSVEIVPARLQDVRPPEVKLQSVVGQPAASFILCRGNSTFRILSTVCDVEAVSVSVEPGSHSGGITMYELTVTLAAPKAPGDAKGVLTIATNDAGGRNVTVPLRVHVDGPKP